LTNSVGAMRDDKKENPHLHTFAGFSPRATAHPPGLCRDETDDTLWRLLKHTFNIFQLLLAGTSTSMWRQPCQVWIPPGHLPMPIKVTQAPHRARNKRMVAETTATPRHRNNGNLASMRHQIDMICFTSRNFKRSWRNLVPRTGWTSLAWMGPDKNDQHCQQCIQHYSAV
jgi:hypothetical protein